MARVGPQRHKKKKYVTLCEVTQIVEIFHILPLFLVYHVLYWRRLSGDSPLRCWVIIAARRMVDYNCALLENFISQFPGFTAVNQNSSNMRVKKPLVLQQAGNGITDTVLTVAVCLARSQNCEKRLLVRLVWSSVGMEQLRSHWKCLVKFDIGVFFENQLRKFKLH